ncbi:uncharacterized protein LOC130892535 [Diorhabda carinulata]|uniref:uncharacterized protein LOC130892535 n=1 Tax=Diorhabda carinulata TaxID=1163345 RepID=UPI0025A2A06C|nr:uncharacterized protein LOC130892535 [Diorhabda carinulata]
MEDSLLDLEQVHVYLLENGGKVKNRDVVRYFKNYLTDPLTKDENRVRFKSYINTLATTKTEGDDKIILLKSKYSSSDAITSFSSSTSMYSPQFDPRNSVGIPLSPSEMNLMDSSPSRQPPPYRPPPPPPQGTPSSSSLDAMSVGSINSLNEFPKTPQAPPRDKKRDDITPKKSISEPESASAADDKTVSVKERTQKFNRLASVEDELSPRLSKSAEKKLNRGADEDDGVSLTPLEPKKCMEWYVTASRGDYQELIKLANKEPRLVNKKVRFCLLFTLVCVLL